MSEAHITVEAIEAACQIRDLIATAGPNFKLVRDPDGWYAHAPKWMAEDIAPVAVTQAQLQAALANLGIELCQFH